MLLRVMKVPLNRPWPAGAMVAGQRRFDQRAGRASVRGWGGFGRLQIAAKAGQVDQAGRQQAEHQKLVVHRPLRGIDESSMTGSRARVPGFVFAGIHHSFTAWSPSADSRATMLRP